MTHPVARFADVRHHPAATVILIALFWLGGAVLAATARIELEHFFPAAAAVGSIAAIATAAAAYTRFCARRAGFGHAIDVGIIWLVLSIAMEVAVTSRLGHGWYALLGSPARPLLRSVFLFVWIFAPVAFARRQDTA